MTLYLSTSFLYQAGRFLLTLYGMFQCHPYSKSPFSSLGASSDVPANHVLPLMPDGGPAGEDEDAAAAATNARLSSASLALGSLTGLWGYLSVPSEHRVGGAHRTTSVSESDRRGGQHVPMCQSDCGQMPARVKDHCMAMLFESFIPPFLSPLSSQPNPSVYGSGK